MSFFGIILFLGVFIGCIYMLFKGLIYPIYKDVYLQKKYAKDLFDKVRWIALKGNLGSIFINDSRQTFKEVRDRELFKYIEREQYNLKIDNNFCLDFSNEYEKNFVCEILNKHKEDTIQSLFYDSLKKEKSHYKLTFLEYYMISLFGFLDKNLKNGKFDSKVLYTFDSKDGSYTTYKFTDYGFTYQKLFYITTLFCVSNENTKLLFNDPTHTLKGVKENLENKSITFWSYRP